MYTPQDLQRLCDFYSTQFFHDAVPFWFPRSFDPEHGDWFGYLHRDGTVAQSAKGNLFKGPFHLPRQEWYCRQILKDHLKGT